MGTLPNRFTASAYLQAHELQLLGGTRAANTITRMHQGYQEQYLQPIFQLQEHSPAVFPFSHRALRWAFSVIATRSYSFQGVASASMQLIPIADLANHVSTGAILKQELDGSYIFRAPKALRAGESFYASYVH